MSVCYVYFDFQLIIGDFIISNAIKLKEGKQCLGNDLRIENSRLIYYLMLSYSKVNFFCNFSSSFER